MTIGETNIKDRFTKNGIQRSFQKGKFLENSLKEKVSMFDSSGNHEIQVLPETEKFEENQNTEFPNL
jgi:hypothetical protein